MLLGFVFFALAVFESALSQRNCSRDRMRQCNDMLQRNIQKRINTMGRQETNALCLTVREDFNCLLRETRCLTSEIERNRNGDTLRNALKYIRDGCDTNGASWRDSTCYIGDTMKACENTYPLGGAQYASHNPETCRKFNLFQECVMDTVNTRCRPDDDKLLGQYLVDSAQDLAWNCGEFTSSSARSGSSWDRTRDDRYDRYDRNGDRTGDRTGDRDRDRDRDRDWDRGRGDSYRDRDRDRDRGYSRDRDEGRYNGGSSSDRYNGGSSSDRYNGGSSYDRGYGGSDVTCCRNERCSSSRMQQCRDSLTRVIDSRTSGYQDSQKCRKTRDDFNCLLWQTSNCMSRNERDRDNDLFRKAKDFISRNCDTYGRWSENSCYKSTEMQRCENGLSNTRGGYSYDSCKMYTSFRDCMQDELRRRCTREDELYHGAYLTDKAHELSWQCGEDQSQYNGRDQYFTENRRDPYDGGRNGYDTSPEHLDDDDAMCQSRVEVYNEQCKKELDDKRREIYITNEYEERQKINCCSARRYRACLFDATRRVCQAERSRVVDAFMGRFSYELSSDNCRKIYESDCNSGNHYEISMMLVLLCAIILPMFLHSHL